MWVVVAGGARAIGSCETWPCLTPECPLRPRRRASGILVPSGRWDLVGLVPQTKTFSQTCRNPAPARPSTKPGNGLKSSQCCDSHRAGHGGGTGSPKSWCRIRMSSAGAGKGGWEWQRCPIHAHGNEVLCAQKKPSFCRGAGCVRVWEFRLCRSNLGCLEKSPLCI